MTRRFTSPTALTCAALVTAACASFSGPSQEAASVKTVELGGRRGEQKAAPAMPGVNVPAIKVNTVGYPTQWTKLAIFNVEPKNAKLVDASGKAVWTASAADVKDRGLDEASQDKVWQVDFSAFKTPGKYTLESDGAKSDPFEIGDGLYEEPLVAGLKSFYFQRTRTALVMPYAEWKGQQYTRKSASHAHDEVGWDLEHYPAKKNKFKPEAGWHDAGNYDMYVPSTAPTAQALLMAYEWAPQRFADKQLNIPESGNGIPDILDETKWGLLWVLSMQVDSGAFRHREAVMASSPEGPADQDKTERWIAGVSTAGTAKAVAVLAQCSRVYAKHDKAFAARCGEAAKKGWAFLQKTKERIIADGKGAEQPLWDDEPGMTDVGARYVAAAEMWRTFRDKSALELARALLSENEAQASELTNGAWGNLSRWALATLALDSETPSDLKKVARERLVASADAMLERTESNDGYRCASGPKDYYWASNSNLMEKAHILAVASRLNPEKAARYMGAVHDQWHWVLGRNPNGYSMVTRVGKGPDRFYHMEWGAMEPPPPGFLVGGPNAVNMGFLAPGAPAKALLWDNPRTLSSGLPKGSLWHWRQEDLWDSGWEADGDWNTGWWCVSEPDIYYSANFVLVAATLGS
jgi:endoglucanase